ncbi:MAG: helix-turn-helix domain-containing protein [Rhodospirillales bacterium]|nr:helix-turn-helix domain-containing protein [Rhodospirillales bacterium]MYE18937.1 helix-turn-helix domain-containing protein [Rhodospirillales bacterium]
MLVNRFDQVTVGNRFLRPREAAEILGLSPRTLDRRRSRGLGPAYYKFGSAVRYRLSDLNAWAGTRQDTLGVTKSGGKADG